MIYNLAYDEITMTCTMYTTGRRIIIKIRDQAMVIIRRATYLALGVMCLATLFLGSCARLPDNFDRTTSFAVSKTEDTKLGQRAARILESSPGESAYLLLGNGLDAFVARVALAHDAEKSIDAQYYLLHNDMVGRLFVDQLIIAADRGVRVRLLVDDMDMEDRDFRAAVLDSHPNIEVRLFNPFGRNTNRIFQYFTGFGDQTRRAHNKSFTVDSVATILGGRNIGNQYFGADSETGFLDLDVLAIGPVASMVSGSFDTYWNHELSYPVASLVKTLPTKEEINTQMAEFKNYISEQKDSVYAKALAESNLAQARKNLKVQLLTAKANVIWDHPDKLVSDVDNKSHYLITDLTEYLENTSKELVIISPYFVPGKSGVAFFKKLRAKGVRVVVLTNSLSSTDVPVVHAGYANYRKALLGMGVELYELNRNLQQEIKAIKNSKFYESKSSLHAKAFVFDREKTFIGSLNLDARSLVHNTEIGIIIESAEIADSIASYIDKEIDKLAFRLELKTDHDNSQFIVWHGIVDGKQTTLTVEPYTGFWQRFTVGFMRMLPIESQL